MFEIWVRIRNLIAVESLLIELNAILFYPVGKKRCSVCRLALFVTV